MEQQEMTERSTAKEAPRTVCLIGKRSPDAEATGSIRDRDTASRRPPSRFTVRQRQARRVVVGFRPARNSRLLKIEKEGSPQ
jgi:hypothetical protein